MKNDRYLKFTTLKITTAVIISLFLHLIFFTKFEFNEFFISKNNDQANELEIFVTSKKEKDINQTKPEKISKPSNLKKKLSNNKREKKDIESKPIIKEDLVTNSQNITKEGVVSKRLIDKTKILSNLRNEASVKLSQGVNIEFPVLKLDNAIFKIIIHLLDESNWNSNGMDNVVFQIETNRGAGFESIEKIASGGELSRIMLATKVSLSSGETDFTNKKTLIFDEVDTGVGGAVADAIGKRLLLLGRSNQVLAVTHHPQVAAISNHHFKVNKSTNNSFTTTSINNLEFKDRIEEVARMLSGEKITDAARNAAESLFLNNKNL